MTDFLGLVLEKGKGFGEVGGEGFLLVRQA
jgi:hypothetical protein